MMKKNNVVVDYLSTTICDEDLSIYIHIPFCEKRCFYCDFASNTNFKLTENYFKYLEKEILSYKEFLKNKSIKSIFIGGGTPSSVDSEYIKNILSTINSITNLSDDIETTIELNPNSFSKNKLEDYLSSGINRFSLGVQSFNENILKIIGRIHNISHVEKSVEIFKEYKIKNFSLDLMLGLPNQTIEDIKISLDYINEFSPSHISYYSLILEDGTSMKKYYEDNSLKFPNEDMDRDMYHFMVNELKNMGYEQYEISNFSKKGFTSKHNLRYWHLKNYIGVGLSSHSNINMLRYANPTSLSEYFENLNNGSAFNFYEILTKKDRINEYVSLGLRLNLGINFKNFYNQFKLNFLDLFKSVIEKNLKLNLIKLNSNNLSLTDKGRDLSNLVEVDFFLL